MTNFGILLLLKVLSAGISFFAWICPAQKLAYNGNCPLKAMRYYSFLFLASVLVFEFFCDVIGLFSAFHKGRSSGWR